MTNRRDTRIQEDLADQLRRDEEAEASMPTRYRDRTPIKELIRARHYDEQWTPEQRQAIFTGTPPGEVRTPEQVASKAAWQKQRQVIEAPDWTQQPAAVDSVRNDLNNAWQQPNVDPMQYRRNAATPDPVQAPPEALGPRPQQGGQTGTGYFSGYNYYNPNATVIMKEGISDAAIAHNLANPPPAYPKNPDGTYKSDLMDTQDESYGLNPTNAMPTSTPSDPALYAAGIRAS